MQRFLDDEPVRARRVSPMTRFNRWCKRNPAVAGLTIAIAILMLVATGLSLAAAMTFQRMAHRNEILAGELKTALGDAQTNLKRVKEQELLAQTNLGLATAEQQRAESNLDLALKAMDAVYLEAIGIEKLLGEPAVRREGGFAASCPRAAQRPGKATPPARLELLRPVCPAEFRDIAGSGSDRASTLPSWVPPGGLGV